MELADKHIQRFWKRVKKGGLNECWTWTGGKASGYGKLRVENQIQAAHRISYQLAYGDCPDSLMVLHACDNRQCVNPCHLTIGTCADNLHDMVLKGRSSRGEKNGHASIKTDQAIQIKKLLAQKLNCTQVARVVGVTVSTVKNIARGHTWKHINVDAAR